MTDTAPTPDDPRLRAILRERFGIESLHPPQERAIDGVLAGRDVLVTLPTGGGKSLVYQLPAVVLDGLTLVLSPLIALMKDQVDALVRKGVRASYVNSSLDAKQRAQRLAAAAEGAFDLLYVTPERFRSPRFLELLPRLNVTRLAVDEAHCISHWGHDFRPDYSRVGEYRRLLGEPPTVALTATATPQVAADIVAHLDLREPLVVRTGIERPNFWLGVERVSSSEEKIEHLLQRMAAIPGPGIVYSALIRDLEAMHEELRRRGVPSLVYHGGLSPQERRSMQERFMRSGDEVVLATNAFGMGIDKADIRFVIHAQLPRTLEAWAQEIGRAGRDGEPSWCELMYFDEDIAIQQGFVGWANPDLEYVLGVWQTLRGWGERLQAKELDDLRDELLVKNRRDNRVAIALKWFEVLGLTRGSFETHDLELLGELDPDLLPSFVGSGDKLRGDLQALLAMVRFATDVDTCRRVLLARHFETGEPDGPCGACDHCLGPPAASEAWLAEHFTPRASRPEPPPAVESERAPGEGGQADFQRGDWVRVDGRHVGQVLRVEGEGKRVRLLVEGAGDLLRRTVDPRRRRVERL